MKSEKEPEFDSYFFFILCNKSDLKSRFFPVTLLYIVEDLWRSAERYFKHSKLLLNYMILFSDNKVVLKSN